MSLAQHLHLSPTTPPFFQRLPQRNWVPSGCWFQVPVPRQKPIQCSKNVCNSKIQHIHSITHKKIAPVQQRLIKKGTRNRKNKKTSTASTVANFIVLRLPWGLGTPLQPWLGAIAGYLFLWLSSCSRCRRWNEKPRNQRGNSLEWRVGESAMGRSEYYSHLRTVFI